MPQPQFQRTPLLNGEDVERKREEIRSYFHTTLDRYEQLFQTLRNDEAYYKSPITLRHPLIFYLGHTATFFVNKLVLAGTISERINPKLESIFAVGVDEMSWDDLDTSHYDWPTVAAVYDYRNIIRRLIDQLITDLPLTLPITWESAWWPIIMGIEHELIHLETSSVLIRQHALEHVIPHENWAPCRTTGAAPQNQLITVAAGHVQIGENRSEPNHYGWDNEFGQHAAEISAFQASQYLVSNQEFLAFVEADGYATDDYWEEEGCKWKNYVRAQQPAYWIKTGC